MTAPSSDAPGQREAAPRERLIPWFMCAECAEYAPVTDLRVDEEDWLSGEALSYVHCTHDDSDDEETT